MKGSHAGNLVYTSPVFLIALSATHEEKLEKEEKF